MIEKCLEWYAVAYGWSVVAFRYFNACGAVGAFIERHDPETHIIPLLLDAAAGKRSHFDIYGTDYETPDGTCLRDYVHVEDIADAHILALRHMDTPGMATFNIGLGSPFSVLQACKAVEEVSGVSIDARPAARRPGDPAVLCASPEKLISTLGWAPKYTDLREIIATAWESYGVLPAGQLDPGPRTTMGKPAQ